MSPIRFYAASTPNNEKVSIALAEMALPFEIVPMDLSRGDQAGEAFIAVNPNGKTPAILDPDGPGGRPLAIFESGAILMYLAEKSGRFLPSGPAERATAIAWTFWQMANLGPAAGQSWHFARRRAEMVHAFNRFASETRRLWRVLDDRLEASRYVGSSEYSIADMAVFPWIAASRRLLALRWEDHQHVRRWSDELSARPAIRRGAKMLRFE